MFQVFHCRWPVDKRERGDYPDPISPYSLALISLPEQFEVHKLRHPVDHLAPLDPGKTERFCDFYH